MNDAGSATHTITVAGSAQHQPTLVKPEPAKIIKTGPSKIIEYAFALVLAAMILSMGAAFCVKFLRWAI